MGTIAVPKLRRQQTTGKIEWFTPHWIVDVARAIMGGITLDPCSTTRANEYIGATTYYTQEQDGLSRGWGGNVFMNPPYARGYIAPFINKLCDEISEGNVEQAFTITNNDTDTRWAQRLFENSDIVCFLKKRVSFLNGDMVPVMDNMQGQMLWYTGKHLTRFRDLLREEGTVMVPVRWRAVS